VPRSVERTVLEFLERRVAALDARLAHDVPDDAPALAARILDALADPAAAERIGQAAQRRAQEFSVDAMSARLADYYERLIAAGDRSRVSA